MTGEVRRPAGRYDTKMVLARHAPKKMQAAIFDDSGVVELRGNRGMSLPYTAPGNVVLTEEAIKSLKAMPIKKKLSEVGDGALVPVVAYVLNASWTEADGSSCQEGPMYANFRHRFGGVYPRGSNFTVVIGGFVFVVCPAPGYDAGAGYELDAVGGTFELRRVGD